MSYENLEDFKNSSQLIDENKDAQFGWLLSKKIADDIKERIKKQIRKHFGDFLKEKGLLTNDCDYIATIEPGWSARETNKIDENKKYYFGLYLDESVPKLYKWTCISGDKLKLSDNDKRKCNDDTKGIEISYLALNGNPTARTQFKYSTKTADKYKWKKGADK